MVGFDDFVKENLGRTENDSDNIWVKYDGVFVSIDIDTVMNGKPETEPFEASTILDNDPDHIGWEELYKSYTDEKENQE